MVISSGELVRKQRFGITHAYFYSYTVLDINKNRSLHEKVCMLDISDVLIEMCYKSYIFCARLIQAICFLTVSQIPGTYTRIHSHMRLVCFLFSFTSDEQRKMKAMTLKTYIYLFIFQLQDNFNINNEYFNIKPK